MFDNLSDKLTKIFNKLTSPGVITRSIKEIALARFEGTARRAPTVQKGQLVFRSE